MRTVLKRQCFLPPAWEGSEGEEICEENKLIGSGKRFLRKSVVYRQKKL